MLECLVRMSSRGPRAVTVGDVADKVITKELREGMLRRKPSARWEATDDGPPRVAAAEYV